MPKKILFICNHASFFLSHRYNLYKISKKNFDPSLLIGRGASSDHQRSIKILKNNNTKFEILNFHTSKLRIYDDFISLIKIYKFIKKNKPSVVHCISLKPILFCAILSKFLDSNFVFSFSGFGYLFINSNLKFLKNLYILFLKYFLAKNKCYFIVQNTFDQKFISNSFRIDDNKLFLIKGSGVNLSKFNFSHLLNKNNNITFLSRPLKSKGIYEFCKAAEILKTKHPSWNFFVVGDLDYKTPDIIKKKYLHNLINSKILTFIPHTNDVLKIYNFTKIICLPSYREGFPKVLQEAQACGIPVITSNDPGCIEAIIPNKTGLISKIGDVSSIVKSIEKLILDEELYKKMQKNCVTHAKNNFDIDVVSKKHMNIYNKINEK